MLFIIELISSSEIFGNAIRIFFFAIVLFLNKGPKYFPIYSPKADDNLRPIILKIKKKNITKTNSKKYLMIFIKIVC